MSYRGPDYTCPHFNKAIEEIENARSANIEMRQDATEFHLEAQRLRERLSDLEDELAEAYITIRSLESALSAFQRNAA